MSIPFLLGVLIGMYLGVGLMLLAYWWADRSHSKNNKPGATGPAHQTRK